VATSVKKESKILAHHALIYGLGNLLNRIVGFLMIPIYTRFFSPSDYGVMELVTLTTQIISIIASAGIANAIGRFYFQYEDSVNRNEVLSTSIIAFSLLSLIIIGPLCLMGSQLSLLLFGTVSFSSFFFISILSIWTSSLSAIGFLYMRIRKQSLRFLLFSLLKLIIALGLNVYFVVYLKVGVIGVLYSTLISSSIFMLLLNGPILFHTGLKFSRDKFNEIVKFGLPLIPASLGNMIVLSSDRFFLNNLCSMADTGLYSLASRFAVIPSQFVTYPFMQIWDVRRLEIYKQKKSEEFMGRVFTYFCLLIILVGLGVSVLARDVIMIMADSKFWSAYKVIPILILAQVIVSFFQHFNFGILITKKTKLFSYIDLTNGTLNLVLNYFLIKKYGVMGAAFATLISYTLRVVMVYIVTVPLYKIHFEAIRVCKLFAAAFVVYVTSTLFAVDSVWHSLSLNFLLLLLFPFILFGSNFFRKDEVEWGKSSIRKILVSVNVVH